MTYKDFLKPFKEEVNKKGLELDALNMLIKELLNISNTEYILNMNKEIPLSSKEFLTPKLNRFVINNEPVQHILGYSYFYGRKFKVSKDVLIPRFETEELVEHTIKIYKEMFNGKKVNILDIGTGSGAISVTLKKEIPNAIITATDISDKALLIAKENAKTLGADISFIQGDMLEPFLNGNIKFDIIVSNPPYIKYSEKISSYVKDNEPNIALFANDEGMYFYNKILKDASKILNHPSAILFEQGYEQKELMENLVMKYFKDSNYKIIKDLNGKDRFTIIKNK